MPYPPNFQQNYGFFVPTTNVWDIQQINSVDVNSQDFKLLLINLYQNINKLSLAVNGRDNGYYMLDEMVNNQSWFTPNSRNITNPRMDYRKVINFGALPNAATKSVPHGITVDANLSWTFIYGTATDPINFLGIPLPFVSTTGSDIQLDVDATNVNITTTIDYSAYTISYIVLEYLKY